VSASVELPAGPVVARVVATHAGRPGGSLDVALFYDDVPVGEGTVPRTTPFTYGTPGFAVGYQPFGPIDPLVDGRAAIPDGVLGTVVVEAEGRDALRAKVEGARPPVATRADLATQ
jgi:hypothetical protein